jgi:hypothetical protein
MMQTDVLYSRITESGWIISTPCRVKGVRLRNAATGVGRVFLFDTTIAPVTATYGQSTTTVTVTKASHGLNTGDTVSIGYSLDASNKAATSGTYTITRVDANTFTIIDLNSFTVSASTACYYVTGNNRWLWVQGIASGDIYNNFELFPGQGLRAKNKVYAIVNTIISVSVFYG